MSEKCETCQSVFSKDRDGVILNAFLCPEPEDIQFTFKKRAKKPENIDI